MARRLANPGYRRSTHYLRFSRLSVFLAVFDLHLRAGPYMLSLTRTTLPHAGCLSGHHAPLPEMVSPTWSLWEGSLSILKDHISSGRL